MKAILSEKGQVTVPKPIRERLGLVTGSVLDFDVADGKLVARKAIPEDSLSKWRGRGQLPGRMRVDEYLKKARDGHSG